MAGLTLSAIPGFTDVADSAFDAGTTASDAIMKALNALAKFAAVRNEQFWGYYRNGETVALPVSPADGYEYQRDELLYSWSVYWSGTATGALNGTQTPPARGITTPGGDLLQYGANIDQATGVITLTASYFNGTTATGTDGILLVITHAQRLR